MERKMGKRFKINPLSGQLMPVWMESFQDYLYSFSFDSPTDPEGDAISLQLQVSDQGDFSNIILDVVSHNDESGWWIFTGTNWTAFSDLAGTGVIPSGYQGNRTLYKFSNSEIGITPGYTYYYRIRASDDGGGTWSDWISDAGMPE